eukprot:1036026-Prymnesium_polylepis.1
MEGELTWVRAWHSSQHSACEFESHTGRTLTPASKPYGCGTLDEAPCPGRSTAMTRIPGRGS